jgi:hypothetical protein
LVAPHLYESTVYGTRPPPLWLGTLIGGVGFDLAAIGVAPGRHRSIRAAVALGLIATLAVAPTLDPASTRADRHRQFSALTVPLLVPQVEGYRLRSAWARPSDSTLWIDLVATGEEGISSVVWADPQRVTESDLYQAATHLRTASARELLDKL